MTLENVENLDAQKVNTAIDHITSGDMDIAFRLLKEVIVNTPRQYVNEYEKDGTLFIKFWDQHQFTHYVTWQRQYGQDRPVTWRLNAYPRACYYLGYVCIQAQQYEKAISILNTGHTLEPTNPRFVFEKAYAYLGLENYERAVALYDKVRKVTAYVTGLDKARALRGKGSVLVELGKLNDAEDAFQESLKYDPNSEVARDELVYIKELCQGGIPSTASAVTTNPSVPVECKFCKQRTDELSAYNLEGQLVYICEKCRKKQKNHQALSSKKRTKVNWFNRIFQRKRGTKKTRSIVLDNSLRNKSENIAAPWTGYGLALSNRIAENPHLVRQGDSVYQPSFEDEVSCRETMLKIWSELKTADYTLSDDYLDQALTVWQVGFLREYVWMYLKSHRWDHEPRDLRMIAFLEWNSIYLGNHRARTLAYVSLG